MFNTRLLKNILFVQLTIIYRCTELQITLSYISGHMNNNCTILFLAHFGALNKIELFFPPPYSHYITTWAIEAWCIKYVKTKNTWNFFLSSSYILSKDEKSSSKKINKNYFKL